MDQIFVEAYGMSGEYEEFLRAVDEDELERSRYWQRIAQEAIDEEQERIDAMTDEEFLEYVGF